MHDRRRIVLRKLDTAYDPTNRSLAAAQIHERMKAGEYLPDCCTLSVGE